MTVDKRINYRDAGYVSQAYSSRSTPSAPTRTAPNMSGLGRQQYSAVQTETGAVKGGGKKIGTDKKGNPVYETGFVGGDRGRDSREEFIKKVQKTNPGYTGGPTRNLPTVGEFFGGILNASPIVNFLRNLSRGIRNTDFGRSTSLMDYLDMRKYGGYDEREMARRINLDEAKLLQDRIDAGEFGGLDTMLDEVALTTGSSNQDFNRMFDVDKISNLINTGGITNTKVEPPDFMFASPQFQEGLDNSMYGGDRMLFGADKNKKYYYGDVLPGGDIIQTDADGITNYDFDTPVRVGPENTGFIEVQDTPQSQDDFFLNAMADATTFPTDDGSGISLMNRSILRNAGYNDSQIKEAQDAGYLDQLIRDIEGPIGGSLGPSAFG